MKNTSNNRRLINEEITAHAIKMITIMFERFGRVPTTFTCIGESEVGHIFPQIYSDADKDAFTGDMRLACVASSAFASVFFSEAWDLMVSREEFSHLEARPSEHPDRLECVVLFVETTDKKTSYVRFPITTGGNGKRNLGKPVCMPFDGIGGRFANVLPPRPPTEAERTIARCVLERKGLFPFRYQANPFQNN